MKEFLSSHPLFFTVVDEEVKLRKESKEDKEEEAAKGEEKEREEVEAEEKEEAGEGEEEGEGGEEKQREENEAAEETERNPRSMMSKENTSERNSGDATDSDDPIGNSAGNHKRKNKKVDDLFQDPNEISSASLSVVFDEVFNDILGDALGDPIGGVDDAEDDGDDDDDDEIAYEHPPVISRLRSESIVSFVDDIAAPIVEKEEEEEEDEEEEGEDASDEVNSFKDEDEGGKNEDELEALFVPPLDDSAKMASGGISNANKDTFADHKNVNFNVNKTAECIFNGAVVESTVVPNSYSSSASMHSLIEEEEEDEDRASSEDTEEKDSDCHDADDIVLR